MGELAGFLPLIAIVALFWLLVIRPASKRQKNMARMQSALEPGNRVMLSSGIFGTIRTISDDRIRVEIAPGVEIEVVRAAIGQVDEAASRPPADPTDPIDPADPTDPSGPSRPADPQ